MSTSHREPSVYTPFKECKKIMINRSKPIISWVSRALLSVLFLSGCSTTYFHDDYPPNSSITSPDHLPFSATQHDGLVNMLREEKDVDLSSACGPTGWKTIKTEASFTDIMIRAIANPIWGTLTVEYQCDENPIAQVEETSPHSFHNYP